ncbi:MAG: protein O-mannosyl-transferase family [bacterium]
MILISLAFSIWTLPQDLVWGDSPELAAGAWILGVPHPTGYSFYMLALRLFQSLPFGTVIFRGHLFSAVCTALACGILYRFLELCLESVYEKKRALSILPAFAAATAFPITHGTWSQSVITEVYAFFGLQFTLTLWLLFHFLRSPAAALAPLLFLLGWMATHHRLSVFLIAVVLVLMILRFTSKRSFWIDGNPAETWEPPFSCFRMIPQGLFLLIPLVLLAYFPLRAARNPAVNWYDPETFQRWYQLISGHLYTDLPRQGLEQLGRMYATFGLGRAVLDFLFLVFISHASYGLLGAVAAAGWIVLFRRMPWLGGLAVYLYLAHLAFLWIYPVGDRSVFLFPTLLVLSIPLAFGLAGLLALIARANFSRPVNGLILAAVALCAVLSPLQIRMDLDDLLARRQRTPLNFSRWDGGLASRLNYASDFSAADYARRVWRRVPAGVPLITGLHENSSDNELYPLLYQQIVEKRGRRVTVIGAGFLYLDWYRSQIARARRISLPPREDQKHQNRDEWLEDVWQNLITPLREKGTVYAASYPKEPLPAPWKEQGPPKIDQWIPIDRTRVSPSYQPYLPEGFLYMFPKPERSGNGG